MDLQLKESNSAILRSEVSNGKSIVAKKNSRVPEAIDEWRKVQKSRQCEDYSDMNYWQVVSTCSAL